MSKQEILHFYPYFNAYFPTVTPTLTPTFLGSPEPYFCRILILRGFGVCSRDKGQKAVISGVVSIDLLNLLQWNWFLFLQGFLWSLVTLLPKRALTLNLRP